MADHQKRLCDALVLRDGPITSDGAINPAAKLSNQYAATMAALSGKLRLCKSAGFDVKNQLSSLEPDQQQKLEELVKKASKAPAPVAPAKPVVKVVAPEQRVVPTLTAPKPVRREEPRAEPVVPPAPPAPVEPPAPTIAEAPAPAPVVVPAPVPVKPPVPGMPRVPRMASRMSDRSRGG